MSDTERRLKLIEVALPLEAISAASKRDKDRKTGTIRNVHKWFAPMPTPAWRALLFASLVDDPGSDELRKPLLDLIVELAGVDGLPPTSETISRARKVMAQTGPAPTILDPFCGGGSTIVEAQRLGLGAVGSDLNPVPVLISKVLCELLPPVVGRASISGAQHLDGTGGPFEGFIADLRHYADRIRDEAAEQLSQLYPPVHGGTVIAWLWAWTVSCPNPGCGATMPLYSTTWLSKRRGAERWLKPVVEQGRVRFEIGEGPTKPPAATKVGRGAKFRCLVCGETAPDDHIKSEGSGRGLGFQPLAMVVERGRGQRDFLAAPPDLAAVASITRPEVVPDDATLGEDSRALWCYLYGLKTQADLYTPRQLHTLGVFADLCAGAASWVRADGGDEDYVRLTCAVLGLCVGKLAMSNSTQSRWKIDSRNGSAKAEAAFGRQALPMVWDFAEANPFGGSAGDWKGQVEATIAGLRAISPSSPAHILQSDARLANGLVGPGTALVATDPPYFGQIGYADLSDYFYVWHRRVLREIFPDLYSTMVTPKAQELISAPYRHGGNAEAAYDYYVDGFTQTFRTLAAAQNSDYPMLVIYAHRQEETTDEDGLTSSAWDALLEAMLRAGLGVVGTWPIHATSSSRQIGQGTNSLASYVVLVCRPRSIEAPVTDRPGLLRALREELPPSLAALQAAATLPFDLTQAAIGPGLSVFSSFSKVIEPTGEPMRVRTAIGLINQVRSEALSDRDDEFDAETRWAIQWFDRFEFEPGPFGEAEKLFMANATSLEGLLRTGIVESRPPTVRLLDPASLSAPWDPLTDTRTCTWELTMHLLHELHEGGGERAAASLLAKVLRSSVLVRDLAYRVADLCESRQRPSTALLVNGLIASWPEIQRSASERTEARTVMEQQTFDQI